MHSKDGVRIVYARPASFQIQNGGWAIWSEKKTESSFSCIVSFLKPRNLRRPTWWDHFAVRPLSETTLLIKITGGQNPSMSLGSPALNKMAIFLQIRAFPLTGKLFLTPPEGNVNMIWNEVQGLWLPSNLGGDICSKEEFPGHVAPYCYYKP